MGHGEQLPQATTRATSALPSKIDEDWENLCSESVSCRSWWLSGKPRKLAKVTACSTPTLSVNSTDRNSESTTTTTTTTTPVSYRDSGTQAKEGESRTNNCHFPNTGENYNIGGGGNSGNNNYNNYRIRNRQQQSRQRATRTRQQQEGYYHPPTAQYRSSLSSHHPAGQGSSIHIRPAKQHRPPAPPRGRGEETPTPSFPSPPPGFSNIVPQPPLWGQTPGWQWAPNLPYLNNHANQQQLRHRTDIAVVTETWLTSEVESTFGKIPGYTHWIREDRHRRQGGGVAICLKEGLQAHRLDIETPPLTEAVFLRVVMANGTGLLLCAMYRSPRQGPDPINFLTEHLDDLLTRHRCRHVLIVEVGVAREEAVSRTIWLWDRADWSSLRKDLQRTDWGAILTGCADEKARAFTERLKSLQRQHVPHRQYTSRPTDQPWFGYRCRLAVYTIRQVLYATIIR
ncbi:hypothetical protein Pmani_014308 [Petrolisthes manimaculis]|uniref:Uncharacterized protein n=1 Tax=Petrolisthes manimaculis TaxID=1843537 RepID=A0AAE1UB47_9EUCA|nr:hypothetical protein Pmani_014308 [Petrolisthes manimaculis]